MGSGKQDLLSRKALRARTSSWTKIMLKTSLSFLSTNWKTRLNLWLKACYEYFDTMTQFLTFISFFSFYFYERSVSRFVFYWLNLVWFLFFFRIGLLGGMGCLKSAYHVSFCCFCLIYIHCLYFIHEEAAIWIVFCKFC